MPEPAGHGHCHENRPLLAFYHHFSSKGLTLLHCGAIAKKIFLHKGDISSDTWWRHCFPGVCFFSLQVKFQPRARRIFVRPFQNAGRLPRSETGKTSKWRHGENHIENPCREIRCKKLDSTWQMATGQGYKKGWRPDATILRQDIIKSSPGSLVWWSHGGRAFSH